MSEIQYIEFDLDAYKIHLKLKDNEDPLILFFDTPSRRFYFSFIAFIISEMKTQAQPEFIYIRKHEKILKLLDDLVAGKNASKDIQDMWEKIRKAWRNRLPDLEAAAHFKILNRETIPPSEKGGKYRYACSEAESDTWANFFQYDESNKWRFKFAVDSASLSLKDIRFKFEDLRNNAAWEEFVSRLHSAKKIEKKEDKYRKTKESRKLKKVFVPAMILLAVLLAGILLVNHYLPFVPPSTNIELSEKPSIAVLPFVNTSDDPDKEYFCDGITEEIINNLARLNDLHVISRTSAFYFKNKRYDIRTIGEKLNVDHVLEGSVRVSGDKLRISAQLIKAADDSHLWSETYDREMKDIFATQEKLSQEIACSLKSRLGCKGDKFFGKHYTENVEAHNQGRRGS